MTEQSMPPKVASKRGQDLGNLMGDMSFARRMAKKQAKATQGQPHRVFDGTGQFDASKAKGIYHYTERLSIADIRRDKVIRAKSMTLYKDMLRRPGTPTLETPPIVWLTINPVADGTILNKMHLAGWPEPFVGDLWRIVLPYRYGGDLGLGEYTDQAGIDSEWWDCVVETGRMIGSDYTTWRIVPHDIPEADWLGVEVLSGWTEQGPTWERR